MKICAVDGCTQKANSHGICYKHRSRLLRRGTVKDHEPRDCDFCKKPYQPRKTNSMTCSNKCAQALWRVRNREYNVARATKWNKANPASRSAAAAKNYAKRRQLSGKTFDFDGKRWERMLNKSGGACFYCGNRNKKLTLDHVVPVSRGGDHGEGNSVPCCGSCNSSKSNKFLIEWREYKCLGTFAKS